MDFSVGQILVEINKESFIQSLCSGLIGAFIGSIISWKVAEHMDNKSKNRWFSFNGSHNTCNNRNQKSPMIIGNF